jgi:hypothetical protein
MVAFVDGDKPVASGQLGDVFHARQRLQGGDIDDTGGLGPPAAAFGRP